MKSNRFITALGLFLVSVSLHAAQTYDQFPITEKSYSGKKKNSISYSGQIARYVLHDSIKKMIGSSSGDGDASEMLRYYKGSHKNRTIIAPKSKSTFPIKQSQVSQISAGKNLIDKAYKGGVSGWPGNMSGAEVLEFMIKKAAQTKKGYDPVIGYDYAQLFSKTAIGAIFYNQSVDNYLDEKLSADNKPNNKPYKKGAYYTGKEHSWDEGFGYFGAPAHTLELDPNTVYNIAKMKPAAFKFADFNKDGIIDLKSEMTFANAYYAADADKSGKTNYLHEIMGNFLSGRKLIAVANGEKLSSYERKRLMTYADNIKNNWQLVIAEAVFKYAGSVYKDLKELRVLLDNEVNVAKPYRKYAKHWGELKGFSLALQMGGRDLGETAIRVNRLIGFSPVDLTGRQVIGIKPNGDYLTDQTKDHGEYMLHMVKLQRLLKSKFTIKALKNEIAGDLEDMAKSLGTKVNNEND